MVRPTEEIIELSIKLSKLGYRQKIQEGDWVLEVWQGEKKEEYVPYLAYDMKLFQCRELRFIPIPSLEDGLKWLERDEHWAYFYGSVNWWSMCFGEGYGRMAVEVEARTPHEAVLMAMIKVIES